MAEEPPTNDKLVSTSSRTLLHQKVEDPKMATYQPMNPIDTIIGDAKSTLSRELSQLTHLEVSIKSGLRKSIERKMKEVINKSGKKNWVSGKKNWVSVVCR